MQHKCNIRKHKVNDERKKEVNEKGSTDHRQTYICYLFVCNMPNERIIDLCPCPQSNAYWVLQSDL